MPVDTRPRHAYQGPTWLELCQALAHQAWVPLRRGDTCILVRPLTLGVKRMGTVIDVAGTRYSVEVTDSAMGTDVLLTVPHCQGDRQPVDTVSAPIVGNYATTVEQITQEPADMFTEVTPTGEGDRPTVYLQIRGFAWWAVTPQWLTDALGVQHSVIASASSNGAVALRFDGTTR